MRRFAWLLLPVCAGLCQPAFDVAVVKPSAPSPGDKIYINLGAARHGVVTMANVTLSECIRWAYSLTSAEQVTGPAWIDERQIRFDVRAKSAPDTPRDQLRLMMRTLLAERFALRMHNEPKRMEHFELTVAKGGPKLSRSVGDDPAFPFESGTGRLVYSQIQMQTLAILLSRQLKTMVTDATGLPGYFDVKLEWTPDDLGTAGVDIFSAVRQQLGLELVRKNTPVDVWVVDHAEKTPTEN
jgi:uncharacterized protein (TIGR03435 family)